MQHMEAHTMAGQGRVVHITGLTRPASVPCLSIRRTGAALDVSNRCVQGRQCLKKAPIYRMPLLMTKQMVQPSCSAAVSLALMQRTWTACECGRSHGGGVRKHCNGRAETKRRGRVDDAAVVAADAAALLRRWLLQVLHRV
uniref:Uncharacterized protein n=1 Tax=Wuchereria bancrofti TaxID=6293 RepID=A0AAF5Q0H1_WUCBA